MSTLTIARQFCGPPNSGNGGFVCGAISESLPAPATAVLRAPIPLDAALELTVADGVAKLTGAEGVLIGEAGPAKVELPTPPPSPGLEAARAAAGRYIGLRERFHPICFTCGPEREDGDGLRVFTGQVEGAEPGVVAGLWTPHAAFGDAGGKIGAAVVWAALDCPGYFAWVERLGRQGALLGTMTGEVLRAPKVGEELIVLAWPIEQDGRKLVSGVALYGADGELMARGHQVWISRGLMPARPAA